MLSEYIQKKVIKTQNAVEQEINMQRFVNPIVKHTYDSLPRIYGHQTKKRYLPKYKIKNTSQQGLNRVKHKCWNLSLLQEEKQQEKQKLDKQKSLSRFQQNKTVKKNSSQSHNIKFPGSQQKTKGHQRTKSLKSCDFQHHNKLSKPKQKCNKKYCVCKTLYDQYCQQVRKVFVRNSLDNKLRKNLTYNCKKLPKLSGTSTSCLDDHESRHKVSNVRLNTQNIESNGYSSGLMELIKRRQQILKQKKDQQFRQMKDQLIQTISEQQNQTTLDKQVVQIETQDKYVNTDFQDINVQDKNINTIQNKADAQNQTEKEQKQYGKLKHPKKEPMAHLSELKNKYKSKKPNVNNRYCINQHIKGRVNEYYTQSEKQKQEQQFLDSDNNNYQTNIQRNNSRLTGQKQKQDSVRSSSISQISLSKYILKGMTNQDTVFSLLSKKQKQSAANHFTRKQEKKIIKITSEKGLFTIPEEDQYIDYLKGYKPISKDFKIKNLVRSQYFKILKDKDGVFFGQYKDDQKNGKGLQITQREIFQGTFHKNIRMDGCERNIDGTYIGQFVNGKRHGYGKFLWHNGQVFQGQWKLGTKNGHGIWRSPKGDSYEGQWLMNRQHGKGIFKHKNSIYEGQFQNFLKNGSGNQRFANGDKYIGDYQGGKPHGKGKYIWKNGSYYEGYFSKGLRQGFGKWHESDQINYQGEFQNDFKHGRGKQFYKNGDTYQGQFVEGIKTQGIYKSAADGKQIAIQTS